jgi:3',5'-nucleoside bisphosphate phosphatase
MNLYVDLHLHSTCSDGIYPPAEVVRLAAVAGLAAIALCDHDNVNGIDEAMAAGRDLGVEVISGVELSVLWGEYEDIHLLGYGFDHHDAQLRQSLREFQEFREGRNERIVERVNEKLEREGRAPIDFARVLALAGGTVGRPHIAQTLIEAGYVANNDEAFRNYLVPCNVAKRFFPVDEAIALVHRAGGVTSLAHPPFITSDRSEFERLLDALIPLGLEGVEAWNNGSTNDDIDWYITAARRRGLFVTGGSDFHGIEGGQVRIGGGRGNLKIPYTCVEEIRQALARRRVESRQPPVL